MFELVGYGLFFLCAAFPMVRPLLEIKAILFLLLLFGVTLHVLQRGRIDLHPAMAFWLLALVSVGALFSLEGAMLGAPGAVVYGFAIYVLWILIHAFVLHAIRMEHVVRLYWLAIGSTILIALNGMLYAVSQVAFDVPLDLASALNWDVNEDVQAYGATSGYIKINVFGINSMPFLVPMALAGILMVKRPASWLGYLQAAATWTALVLGLLFVFIAGRRALILVTLLSPLILVPILWTSSRVTEAQHGRLMALVAVAGALVFVVAASLNALAGDPFSLVDILWSGFEFSGSGESEALRREQFYALLNGWLERPVTGWGLGASAGMFGSIRSTEYPWSYELYYFALLFQVGILGFSVYVAFVAWIYWSGFRLVIDQHPLAGIAAAFLVGMACFLIASGTNPYLPRFDGLWIFLLPLACINVWLHSSATSTAKNATEGSLSRA